MKRTEFDWRAGIVAQWDMDDLDATLPIADQIDNLKEDLAQIEYPDRILLDIGWYPSFDLEGEFVIVVVEDGNWETPNFRVVANDIDTLKTQISVGISKASKGGINKGVRTL